MNKLPITLGLLGIMLAFAVADAWLLVPDDMSPFKAMQAASDIVEPDPPAIDTNEPTQDPPDSGFAGVKKQDEPEIEAVASAAGFTVQPTDEVLFIGQIIPAADAETKHAVLLKDGDRAGIIAWVQAPGVKRYFDALKQALHESFTPQVTNLIDEKQLRTGKPTRDYLSFTDKGLSDETFIYVRVRQQLIEMRIAPGYEAEMTTLLETLTE